MSNMNLKKVKVWDLPTRIFHWALVVDVICLAVSGLIGGNAMVWHFRFGNVVIALLLFRIIWGLVGGRWSRFSAFIYAPQTVINYLKGKIKPEHTIGHSPIGAISVFAMLAILLAQAGSGLISDDDIAFSGHLTRYVSNATVQLATNYHRNIGKWLLLGVLLLHIAAILFYIWRKKNLVNAMLHGNKELHESVPGSRDNALSRVTAIAIFSLCAAFVAWLNSLSV